MTQIREKWNSLVFRIELTFEWYKGAMIFRVFFLFFVRTNGKKEHLDENDFHKYS